MPSLYDLVHCDYKWLSAQKNVNQMHYQFTELGLPQISVRAVFDHDRHYLKWLQAEAALDTDSYERSFVDVKPLIELVRQPTKVDLKAHKEDEFQLYLTRLGPVTACAYCKHVDRIGRKSSASDLGVDYSQLGGILGVPMEKEVGRSFRRAKIDHNKIARAYEWSWENGLMPELIVQNSMGEGVMLQGSIGEIAQHFSLRSGSQRRSARPLEEKRVDEIEALVSMQTGLRLSELPLSLHCYSHLTPMFPDIGSAFEQAEGLGGLAANLSKWAKGHHLSSHTRTHMMSQHQALDN